MALKKTTKYPVKPVLQIIAKWAAFVGTVIGALVAAPGRQKPKDPCDGTSTTINIAAKKSDH